MHASCSWPLARRSWSLSPAGWRPNDGDPIRDSLTKALRDSGDPHVHVVLLSYQPSTFRLGLKVKRDSAYRIADVLAAVDAALREHYSFEARSLGQPVLQSDVIAVAHSVPGVVAIDLDFLYGGTAPLSQVDKSRQTGRSHRARARSAAWRCPRSC